MKNTTPGIFLTRAVRDEHLTADAFISRFGAQCYHPLRTHAATSRPTGRGLFGAARPAANGEHP